MGRDEISRNNHFKSLLRIGSLVAVSSMLVSCSEPTQQGEQGDIATGIVTHTDNQNNNSDSTSSPPGVGQIFGGGFGERGTASDVTGFIGNGGGFGFNGSIASIIGNAGGFGFGGFGTFASFFAGQLPTTPPNGILLPPDAPGAPGAGAGLGLGAGGGFTPPAGGFGAIPPGVGRAGMFPGNGNGPPGNGNGPGFRFGAATVLSNDFNVNSSNNPVVHVNRVTGNNSVTSIDQSLASLDSTLVDSDLEFVFISPAKTGISTLALTETVTDCPGGGTRTRANDDVDPPSLSTGDARTTTFANCVRGNTTINGSRGFSADLVTGAPFMDPTWSMNTTMFRSNLVRVRTTETGTTTRISDGSTTTEINVGETSMSQSAAGAGTSSRERDDGTIVTASNSNYNFDLRFDWDIATQIFTWDITVGAGTSTETQQSDMQIATTIPFTGTIGNGPTQGQLSVTKTVDNVTASTVALTAQADGTVQVEIDSDADGVVDFTEVAPGWDEALFNVLFSPL